VIALLLASASAPGRPAAEEATTTLSADAVGRYGPVGVMIVGGVARRWKELDGDGPLAKGRYGQLGLSLGASPAYAQGSVAAEWVPLAPIQLRLEYDALGYLGAYGALLRFPSRASRFGQEELDGRAGSERTGLGHRVLFSPVLRARLGVFMLRSQTDLAWCSPSGARGWYYDSEYDTLLAASDGLAANRTAVLAELWSGPAGATLLAGPMYDVTRAMSAGITRQRVGALAYLERQGAALGLDRLRLYALAGVNLSDRNRQGDPFAVLGVGADLERR
jgi:hypothetical protein